MKKLAAIFATLAALALLTTPGLAQFEQGGSYLGPRVGLGVNGTSAAFGAGYEYGVTPEIGIGGLVDYYQYTYTFWSDWGGKYTYTIIGAQGNYHFGNALQWDSKLDPFAGLVLAYESISWKYNGQTYGSWSPTASGIGLGGQAGMRYFFSPHIAFYGQVGFGLTYLKAGVDFKF